MSSMSKFTQRNVFYLRASPYAVLQTILYLDHRHVDWFNANPHILKMLLAVLKSRIMPKLRREADKQGAIANMSKKEKVDVYSEKDWQVAYFFRKMDDRHAVLLKEKSLVFPQDPSLSEVKVEDEAGNVHAPIPHRSSNPHAPQSAAEFAAVKPEPATSAPINVDDDDDDDGFVEPSAPRPPPARGPAAEPARLPHESDEDESAGQQGVEALFRGGSVYDDEPDGQAPAPRRSKRRRLNEPVQIKDEAEDASLADSPGHNDAIEITQDDEEKMKPRLSVKYAGFRIFGKLLVLVVEPTKRYISDHPDLFGEKKTEERRQLSVAPVAAGALASSSRNGRAASTQSRFTSVEPSARFSRNASLARGSTPLFRGLTPATEAGTPAPMPTLPGPDQSASMREPSEDIAERQDGELEGFQLATQMLEREGSVLGTGNDLDEGD
ncbi:uncharacterized protein PFL1_05800 [Pseudozyma flocculosa PF-1]|uniref:Uncharacterized protein n=2 Tax=Pseudozyma flocculosa TaxID=84751 RepID=A0A5C3F3M0_9BASI|nr:uncharacterized protein PFL1_05800 [Pseudozyma flocculosa PF-1]EPQ26478.1 hypothetical protein PFL1_05800 [Pseudozyma flocculosa PF-1]SPO38536.1 uncharacterized protein PSFLO_04014 [Pseudozyma flocculosa]